MSLDEVREVLESVGRQNDLIRRLIDALHKSANYERITQDEVWLAVDRFHQHVRSAIGDSSDVH